MSDLITQLKELKLYGMADCYAELRHQGVSDATASMESSEWLLQSLLKAESTDRAIRSIGYQMHAARFPVHRDLAGFDFSQSRVDETLIRHFATLAFTQTAQNVVLIGGTGTGKTQLMWRARPKEPLWASALGVTGIQHQGKRVRFFSTVELVNALEREKSAGKQGKLAISLMQNVALIYGPWIWSFSMSWAICHSRRRVAPCCSICSPNFMSEPASSSPPT